MILCLETATKNCSVALVSEDNSLLAHRAEHSDKFVHGERLHLLLQETLSEAGVRAEDLTAVCVGKGPGSYTGLRIGVSAAKGLCYALNKPLVSLPTLCCWDFDAVENDKILTVVDARRDEVFGRLWERQWDQWIAVSDEFSEIVTAESWSKWKLDGVTVLGDCAQKVAELHQNSAWTYSSNAFPDARMMQKWIGTTLYQKENVAYFEPFYLKDFVALKPTKKFL